MTRDPNKTLLINGEYLVTKIIVTIFIVHHFNIHYGIVHKLQYSVVK